MTRAYSYILKYQYFLLGLIIAFHAYIITRLIFFPFPEFFLLPYLTNAGLVPYKNIIDQHSPGLFFLPFNAGVLGLSNVFIARIWLIVITSLVNIFVFLITKSISKNAAVGILASLIFFFWHAFWGGWVLWIDTFVPLVLLPAFYLSYLVLETGNKGRNKLIVLLGLVFGIGIILKQTILPIAISIPFLIYFFLRANKIFIYFISGFLPLPLAVASYLLYLGAFWDFIYWAGVFNGTVYPDMSRKGPEYPGLLHMIVSYSPVLFFPLIRSRKVVWILGIFTFWTLAAVIDRFDSSHFQPSLPFLAIGFSLLIYQYFQVKRFIVYLLIYFVVSASFIYQDYKKHISSEVIIYDAKMILLSERVKMYAKPNEEIFVFGPNPLLYYLTGTFPPGKYFVFQMPWYLALLEDKSIEELNNNPPEIVVRDRELQIDGVRITQFASKIDKYIEDNYDVFEKVNNTELLRKKP